MKWIRSFLWLLFLLPTGIGPADAAHYVGAKKCRICHLKEYKSWKQTPMSRAFELLRPGVDREAKEAVGLKGDEDYTQNKECLECHATGGRSDLPGVQCESCHGPGSHYLRAMVKDHNYKRDELLAKGLLKGGEKTCRRCHNKRSAFYKGFDYKQYTERELHFQSFEMPGIHVHFPLKYQHASSGEE